MKSGASVSDLDNAAFTTPIDVDVDPASLGGRRRSTSSARRQRAARRNTTILRHNIDSANSQ